MTQRNSNCLDFPIEFLPGYQKRKKSSWLVSSQGPV